MGRRLKSIEQIVQVVENTRASDRGINLGAGLAAHPRDALYRSSQRPISQITPPTARWMVAAWMILLISIFPLNVHLRPTEEN